MTPLERAARALAERQGKMLEATGASSRSAHQYADERWPDYLPESRAVLTAIREPSEAMSVAGGQCEPFMEPIPPGHLRRPGRIVANAVWEAMIDAALAEGE